MHLGGPVAGSSQTQEQKGCLRSVREKKSPSRQLTVHTLERKGSKYANRFTMSGNGHLKTKRQGQKNMNAHYTPTVSNTPYRPRHQWALNRALEHSRQSPDNQPHLQGTVDFHPQHDMLEADVGPGWTLEGEPERPLLQTKRKFWNDLRGRGGPSSEMGMLHGIA